jgi:hypothetical protein
MKGLSGSSGFTRPRAGLPKLPIVNHVPVLPHSVDLCVPGKTWLSNVMRGVACSGSEQPLALAATMAVTNATLANRRFAESW